MAFPPFFTNEDDVIITITATTKSKRVKRTTKKEMMKNTDNKSEGEREATQQ